MQHNPNSSQRPASEVYDELVRSAYAPVAARAQQQDAECSALAPQHSNQPAACSSAAPVPAQKPVRSLLSRLIALLRGVRE